MSYLIFGDSGFIGIHLVNLLHEQYPAEKIHGIWQAKDRQERQLTIVHPGVLFGTGENGRRNWCALCSTAWNIIRKG
ncbi:MAG: UDP-N-acetylglucosamine 4-epimerase [Bacteroidetes bacterium]|nr:UDP-N-acetylglucosamine 4-epimerase [Bacteroidota bacterium]